MKKLFLIFLPSLIFIGCSSSQPPTQEKPLKAYNLKEKYPLTIANNPKTLIEYYNKYFETQSDSSTFNEDFYHLIDLIKGQRKLEKEPILLVGELILKQDGEFAEMAGEALFPQFLNNPGIFTQVLTCANLTEFMAGSSGEKPDMERLFYNFLYIPIDYSGDTEKGEKKIKDSVKKKIISAKEKNSELGKYIFEVW